MSVLFVVNGLLFLFLGYAAGTSLVHVDFKDTDEATAKQIRSVARLQTWVCMSLSTANFMAALA